MRKRKAAEESSADPQKTWLGGCAEGTVQGERQVPLATTTLPDALANYMQRFRSVFSRSETFSNACGYVAGLLSELERKNGETMARSIEGIANVEAVHQFMALSPWSAEELDRCRVQHALEVAGADQGEPMLIVDEVSQKKRGRKSVGVKRQYLGCAGKTENGQVAVTLHYCDDRYDWPVNGRLYVPQDWANDQQRRKRAGIPADVEFATKPTIAMQLVRRALSWGMRVKWVCMDAGYDDLDVLTELRGLGLSFCVGVKRDFQLRVPHEVAHWIAPSPTRRGRPRKHIDPRSLPPLYRVDALQAALPDDVWKAVTYRDGVTCPLVKEFVALRALCATKEKTGPEVWLLFERPLAGQSGDAKQYVLASDGDLALDDLAIIAHRRPLIERFSYENGKGEVGLRDYQGRSWAGFHHHQALAMLALTWLNLQRRPLPPVPAAAPSPSSSPVAPENHGVQLQLDEHQLNFQIAAPARSTTPIPRHLWESVQSVHRRLVEWFAITVHHALAQRRTTFQLPVFVPLC